MGTKVIFLILFLGLFYTNRTSNSLSQKQKIKVLKEFALCDCLLKNYQKVDTSVDMKDVSLSVYMNSYDFIDHETAKLIDSVVSKENILVNSPESHTSAQVPNSNQIFMNCTNFTNSEYFGEFVNMVVKRK